MVNGELSGLRWQDLSAEAGTLSADYAADNNSAFNTRVELSGLRWREIDLDALAVSASGDTERVQATLQSTGDVQTQLDAAASRHEESWRGQLAPAQVRTGDMTWSLAEPVALTWSPERLLQIAAHCWRNDAARVCPGDWTVGRAGRGSIELAGDLSQLSRLLPPDTELDGELRAEGQVSWRDSAPLRADINVEVQPLVLSRVLGEGERQQVRWSRATATASLRDGALSARAAVHGDTEPPKLVLDIALPAGRDGALQGSLVADGLRLGALTGLVPGVAATDGTLNGRLRLTGSADRPRLEGTLALDDGLLKMTGNPTRLENLDLELQARGDSARLSGTGSLGGGELVIEGDLITEPAPRLTLRLRGSDNNILYPPSADLRASHELQAIVTSGRLSVTGDITIHDGVLEYEQLPDHGVALSADVVRVDEVGSDTADAAPLALDMDVRVRIQEDFRLQGPQLEAALSGDLRLIGKPREPLQVFGSLQTAGGTASAYERTLEIKRGVVSFSGPPDNPNLDLRAQRRISGSNIIAGLHVHGDLGSDLALEVYSEPPMSQSEAMSYLIWGRPPDSGNTGDGTALALSLAGTVVNRSGLVSTINEVPGISNVSFGAEGSEEDTAATVSGYVGERLYLSYGIGIYEPVNVLTARFFLRTRLWLEVVSRLENSLDLYYSFDLD
ncbi:MAG: translocation/assembly module TamB domain-containing protein [Halioglobus sp.]|nr:translocation/assembly module TamB domain-containing protein [Halioglobus sp.]